MLKLVNPFVKMEKEIEKAKVLVTAEIIKYVPNKIAIKTILKKPTGIINVISVDSGQTLDEHAIPFDTFVQIIDGKAEIIVDGISNIVDANQSYVIPAHRYHIIKANVRFKMVLTIIKCGYE